MTCVYLVFCCVLFFVSMLVGCLLVSSPCPRSLREGEAKKTPSTFLAVPCFRLFFLFQWLCVLSFLFGAGFALVSSPLSKALLRVDRKSSQGVSE